MTLRRSPAELVAEALERGDGALSTHDTWERVTLGDVAHVINGEAFSSSAFNQEGHGYPLIRIRDVVRGWTETYYSGTFKDQSLVRLGDIVVGMDGDFEVNRWASATALLNQRVCKIAIRNEEFFHPPFLVACLPAYLRVIWQATPSVTVKHLSSLSLSQIPLPLPPILEQRRITAVLDELQAPIARGVKLLGEARERRAAFENSVFQDITKDSPRIPLKEVTLETKYGTSVKCETETVGIPVLRIPNISSQGVNLESLKYAPIDSSSDFNKLKLESDDLLVVRTNGSRDLIGRCALAAGAEGMIYASYLIRCRLRKDRVTPAWAALALSSASARRQIEELSASSAGQYNLSAQKLMKIEIPIPDIAKQEELLKKRKDMLGESDRLNDTVASVERRGSALHASLMREAMLGRLARRDATDEPASALLDRIKSGLPRPRAVSTPNLPGAVQK